MSIKDIDYSDIENRIMANLSDAEKEAVISGAPFHHQFRCQGTITGRFSCSMPEWQDPPRKTNIPKEE